MPRELYARAVQNWTLVLSACRTTGATAVTRSTKAYAMQALEEGSIVKYEPKLPRWPNPCAEDLLESDSERLLKTSAATEIAVSSSAFGNLLLNSVEKHADRRTSSLVIPRPTRNCGLVIPSHIRCILAS